jgi:hypothetical protein
MEVSCRDNDMTRQGRRVISDYTSNLMDMDMDMNEGLVMTSHGEENKKLLSTASYVLHGWLSFAAWLPWWARLLRPKGKS